MPSGSGVIGKELSDGDQLFELQIQNRIRSPSLNSFQKPPLFDRNGFVKTDRELREFDDCDVDGPRLFFGGLPLHEDWTLVGATNEL